MNKRLLISIIILLTAVIALTAASPAFVDREIQRSDSMNNAGNYTEAVTNLDRLEERIDRKDFLSLSKILNARSETYLKIGNIPAMLKDIRAIIELDKSEELWYFDAEAYLRLAEFHREYDRFVLNRKYIGKAIKVVEKNSRRSGDAKLIEQLRHKILTRRIRAFIASDSANVALAEANRAIKKAHNVDDSLDLEAIRSEAYSHLNRIDSAASICKRLIADKRLNSGVRDELRMNLIGYLIEQNELQSADKEWELLNPSANANYNIKYYMTGRKLAKAHGDEHTEYMYFNRAVQTADSLTGIYSNAMTQVEVDYFEVAAANHEAELARQANRQRLWWIWGLAGLVALATAIAGFALLKSRRGRRRQAIIEKKLGSRNAEVGSLTRRQASMEQSQQEIRNILASKIDDAEKVEEIKRSILTSGDLESPRHMDISRHDDATGEFLAKLRIAHPNLTNAETRIAAFVWQNLSNKDIATAINRSVSTVKYTKSSLKKKLATDISLEEYLRGISAMDDAELARRANIKT